MAEVKCTYRSRDGRELTITGDDSDEKFMNECHKLTGREQHNFGGTTYYPAYTYYTNPVYYYTQPYYYYYYPYYPYYGGNFYGGYRRGCWGGWGC